MNLIKQCRLITLVLFFFTAVNSFAQNLTQTIRGTVIDKESKSALIGATVSAWNDTILIDGSATDVDGNFRIEHIPLGRQSVKVSYIGYKDLVIPNVIISSAKEVILNLELEESAISINEITVSAEKKSHTNNEMSTVSARSFVTEETERYAGSRSDPARMAHNFAGVAVTNDSRNDIVIRGNSPLGLLWRLNDVDIPNPNHFAVAGTTGGPVSVLNNKTLGTSDFMTGAFPAEYGNAIGGVFDLRMRNGNNEKHEFTFQFGALGTELMAEGPISKTKNSSYLATYRYATLAILNTVGIQYGTASVPTYQDASFKLNFPTKRAGNISLFGIGGKSNIAIKVSDFKEPQDDLYGETDRDQYFGTSMGVIGLSHSKQINSTTYTKLTVAQSFSDIHSRHELVYRDTSVYSVIDSFVPKMRYKFLTAKTSLAFSFNKKFNALNNMKAGLLGDFITFNHLDSVYNTVVYHWFTRLDSKENTFLFQPYLQWKHKFNDKWELNTGLHLQFFALNNSFSIEPRAGIRWQVNSSQSLNLGYGMHSQMQPTYIYFHQIYDSISKKYIQHNKELDFTRSHHVVLGYDNVLTNSLRLRVETYYQYVYNAPVDIFSSSYSLLNEGSSYSRFFPDTLTNEGTGTNWGVDITLEKFFSKTYFFLTTISLYESKYKGSDGIERNTDFNGNFAWNILAGKEFNLGMKKNTVLTTGGKITFAGGRRYTEMDTIATRLNKDKDVDVVELDSLRNENQFDPYFRADVKLGLKINRKKVTHEIGIDLVNVTNHKNVFRLNYSSPTGKSTDYALRKENQLGFLPLFYYRLDF